MNARPITLEKTLGVGALLMVLWALSWGLSYVQLGSWSFAIALLIAAIKAIFVVLIFMEGTEQKSSFILSLVSAVVLIGIFISFTAADVATRAPEPIAPPPPAHPLAEDLP